MFEKFPKKRQPLPEAYEKIYLKHYFESRCGKTAVLALASLMEGWLHRQVSRSSAPDKVTLEIGAGTLNQIPYERSSAYDVVEPFKVLYEESPFIKKVRYKYDKINDVPAANRYDRITAIASFEHIENLPEVVAISCGLMKENGRLHVAIPNEGRFLWRFAYKMTTAVAFRRKYGLDYEVLMRYEHINTADEIEEILRHFFRDVKEKLLGLGKDFSVYRYYECGNQDLQAAGDYLKKISSDKSRT